MDQFTDTIVKAAMVIIGTLIIVVVAFGCSLPTELNNGCIEYNQDIYCKEEE